MGLKVLYVVEVKEGKRWRFECSSLRKRNALWNAKDFAEAKGTTGVRVVKFIREEEKA